MNLNKLPQPKKGAPFKLVEVRKVAMPHPYCIGAKLVAYAADHHAGMLGDAAIDGAEKAGIFCDTCRLRKNRTGEAPLTRQEHENNKTLFIEVENNKDLNAIEGLHKYLYGNKAAFMKAGIEGFAFPEKKP